MPADSNASGASPQEGCPFALTYLGDAYSTDKKVMGRQAAGKALIKAVAQRWRQGPVRGLGTSRASGEAMLAQLRAEGYAGDLHWSTPPDWRTAVQAGTVYFPAPLTAPWAAARNALDPAAFSFMGVTHSLSSLASAEQVAALLLPPFQPWDALICTSEAARQWVAGLHEDTRAWYRESLGATRFNDIQLPVIPLGVDAPAFAPAAGAREAGRATLGLGPGEVAFLFAGRLAFQAKANPVPMYQALQKVARERPIACIEAGIYPNPALQRAYEEARRALAPDVRFVWIEGRDEAAWRASWQAADVFVSLADNIQETFGLTPVEAMAAGLPVLVADWSGYRDTVRDRVDGFRIPTIVPPAGSGEDLALLHALQVDSYDLHIGRASLATVVAPGPLEEAVRRLATDASLRQQMGAAGRTRALAEFDWPVILDQYAALAAELGRRRQQAGRAGARPSPLLADPFRRFGHFATARLGASWQVAPREGAAARLKTLESLLAANFARDQQEAQRATLVALLERQGAQTVADLMGAAGATTPAALRALLWLWKFDVVDIRPPLPR